MENVIVKLQSAVDYLSPYLPLVNSHMVEFFTGNLWEKHVPCDLRNELELLSHSTKSAVEVFKESTFHDSRLCKFLKECANFYPNPNNEIIFDIDTFIHKLSLQRQSERKIASSNKFMSFKKEHEVEIMSMIVSILTTKTNTAHIIDIGDGKGYLSSHLALQYGLKVLGLDSSLSKTAGAAKRANKLQKQQPSLPNKLVLITKGDSIPHNETIMAPNENNKPQNTCARNEDLSYKQATLHISPESDLKGVLMQNFPGEHLYHFGIVGLHTCGSLSSVCLKLFIDCKYDSKFLINVGCCYHLLEEDEDAEELCSFPLSNYLKRKQFKLGRNARMLSLQAPERIYSSGKIADSLMFRSVFELFLDEKIGKYDKSEKKVGRIGCKCTNFNEYCSKGLTKLGLDLNVSIEEMDSFYKKYSHYQPLLEFYFMLRVSLAPIIEYIILLDRLLYLLENELGNSFIVKLFEPCISPRCFGIISIKEA